MKMSTVTTNMMTSLMTMQAMTYHAGVTSATMTPSVVFVRGDHTVCVRAAQRIMHR